MKGKIKGKRRRRRRRMQVLGGLKKRRYWNMSEGALDSTAWRTGAHRARGLPAKQTT